MKLIRIILTWLVVIILATWFITFFVFQVDCIG